MSDCSLIVPLELEVLKLPAGQSVIAEMANFSLLPWSDDKIGYNTGTPYLGEVVIAPPFQNQDLNLSSDIHLHWLLPKAHRTSHCELNLFHHVPFNYIGLMENYCLMNLFAFLLLITYGWSVY